MIMKEALKFFGLFFALMGFIGGIGYCLYSGAWVIAICIVVLGGLAYPTAKEWCKGFMG